MPVHVLKYPPAFFSNHVCLRVSRKCSLCAAGTLVLGNMQTDL